MFLADRERALCLEAKALREALVANDASAIRNARRWAEKHRLTIERSITSVWGISIPAGPDWKVLGDPIPEATVTSSFRSFSDDDIAMGGRKKP